MRILHLEASSGWGGQEIRILRESEGMRSRGHEVIFVVQKGGGLIARAREAGFTVYEMSLTKKTLLPSLVRLAWIALKHHIDCINTHSSWDAWVGGILGRLLGKRILRTRHLSTPIRPGLNSKVLYGWLADEVVTTCEAVVSKICEQAKIPFSRCRSVPTGIDATQVVADAEEVQAFRRRYGLAANDIVTGTACMLRSWKGIEDLLGAALQLKDHPHLRWLIVGGGGGQGAGEAYFRARAKEMGLERTVIFTGHLNNPYVAMMAMDIFALLSTASEGVSQASLQAAWLQKPLITTTIGGLPEVCLHGKTGFHVPPRSPEKVAEKVLLLAEDRALRQSFGASAKALVEEKFTFKHMLDEMEAVYRIMMRPKASLG